MTYRAAPFKANHCYTMLDASGFADPGQKRVAGMFLHDTRHLLDYRWDFADPVRTDPVLVALCRSPVDPQ